jgi:AbrB family looped-hinge helix DNA binding protein
MNMQSYSLRIRERGQITIPQPVRDNLSVQTGDLLTLTQIGDAYVLTPRRLKVDELGDKIAAEMEKTGVTLADLLEGLAEERKLILQERQ